MILTYYTVKVNLFLFFIRKFSRTARRSAAYCDARGGPALKQNTGSAVCTIEERTQTWTEDDLPVLKAILSVPVWKSAAPHTAARRMDHYYRRCSRAFLHYCSIMLLPTARAQFLQAGERGAPLPCAVARMDCHITLQTPALLSLYLDCTEWAGTPQALTLRRSDTWDVRTGYPIAAQDCFPHGVSLRQRCLAAAREKCSRQSEADMAVYADHLSGRLRRNLNLRNFYLEKDGFRFFYQSCTIAPPYAGCPSFALPFSEEKGPFLPIIM